MVLQRHTCRNDFCSGASITTGRSVADSAPIVCQTRIVGCRFSRFSGAPLPEPPLEFDSVVSRPTGGTCATVRVNSEASGADRDAELELALRKKLLLEHCATLDTNPTALGPKAAALPAAPMMQTTAASQWDPMHPETQK